MPQFDFSSPDGKSYSVSGPDGATPQQAFAILQQHLGSQQAPQAAPTGLWGQIKANAASIVPGIMRGAAGAASDLAQAEYGNTASAVGQDPSKIAEQQAAIPTRAQINAALPVQGKYGAAIGEALGNPASYLGPNLAESVGLAVLSGLGGQVGEDIGGTAGRIAGSMAAPVGILKAGARAPAEIKAAVPTGDELKSAAHALYQSPEVKAVAINPPAVTNLAATIENDLLQKGFRPTTKSASATFGELRGLRVPPGVESVSIDDIDSARKAFGKYAQEVDAQGAPTAEAAAAQIARGHIDDFLPNLNQSDLLAGDANAANSVLQAARANYRAYKGDQLISTKQANAELQAASTYGGGNINNATRQALRPLLKNNAAGARGLVPEAQDQLQTAVTGTPLGNLARQLGRFSPDNTVGMGLHLGAGIASGGATLPLSIASYGSKKLGEAMTRAEVLKILDTIQKASPLYQGRVGQAAVANALRPPMPAPPIFPSMVRGGLVGLPSQ